MKKLHSHKKPIILGVGIFAVLAIILIFTTCDIGLGQIVNTEKPVINTAGNNPPGTFLQGPDNRIALDVSNKLGFKIVEVWMDVDYIDAKTGEPKSKRVDAQQDPETGEWYVILDTTDMADGPITGKVTAKDESGNTTTTTEMVYNVKNIPPQIKLNMPLVDGENWDNDKFLDELHLSDPLTLGFDLMGLATDDYGIEKGYPMIMIWPAPGQDISIPLVEEEGPSKGMPLPNDTRYGVWRSLIVPNDRRNEGAKITATKFTWPMMYLIESPEGSGVWRLPTKDEPNNFLDQGKYRIKIVTKDLFGNVNEYPNRKDTTRTPDNPSRKFIEINYKASNVPLVQFTEYPQYYNAVNPLEIYFSVSSRTDLTSVKASIVTTNDVAKEKFLEGPYIYTKDGPYTGIEFISKNEASYKFKLTVPAAQAKLWIDKDGFPTTTGIIFAKVQATADANEGPATHQNFIYDNKAPTVIIDRPVYLTNKVASGDLNGGSYEIWYPDQSRPKWVTGSITVGGSVDDNLTLIKNIYYHIGKLGDDDPAADRESIYTKESNWENSNIQYSDLRDPKWSGSLYSWSYTFPAFLIGYKASNGSTIQEHTELINNYFIPGSNGNIYYETTSSTRERFFLPFYVKVVDSANNYKIIHYKLSVDPLLDEPLVTITQPEYKNGVIPIVGGTVRVSGYAEDNYWMHTVLIRVKKDSGYPGGTTTDGAYYIPKTNPATVPFYKSSPGSGYPKPMNGAIPDIDGWFVASKIGDSSMVNWFAEINQYLELDPSGSTPVDVTVEVVAIDCNQTDLTHNTFNIIGPIETLPLQFSKDVPMITNRKIKKTGVDDRDYKEGITASGEFSFSFDVEAIDNINSLTVRVNGASSPIILINQTSGQSVTGWTITNNGTTGGKNNRSVKVTIDSIQSKIPSLDVAGYPYGSTGNLTLEVTAVDNTEKRLSTTNTFIIGVDNFYPTAIINTLNIAADSPPGKYYYVEGTAQDYGSGSNLVQGLDKVLVYFEKANITYPGGFSGPRTVVGSGTFIRRDGNPALDSDFKPYPNVLNHGSSTTAQVSPNDPSYAKFPVLEYKNTGSTLEGMNGWAWTSPVAMVIDSNVSSPTVDNDNDGTYGETWNGGSSAYKEFGARVVFRSPSVWADGPYIVHYMILDLAGNATHYQNDIYLENNKPRITKINFGTDINGVGGVTDGTGGTLNEYLYSSDLEISNDNTSSVAGVMSPSFRIRGNEFWVKLTVANGNGSKGATVTYVEAVTPNIPASSMVKGQVYTISSMGTGIITDFTKYGAPNNYVGTTFVATNPATGTSGMVTSYIADLENNRFTFPLGSAASCTVPVNRFAAIPDSIKTGGEITGSNKNQRFFIVKVYDTTTNTGRTEFDQLADAILVKVDIDNTDNKNPSISVLPFGQEYITPVGELPANDKSKTARTFSNIDSDYNLNISMNGNVRGGYVQYSYTPGTSTIDASGTANISGKVKFLGKAEDNQRIKAIYATITGYNTSTQFQIAQTNTFNKIVPISTNPDWTFKVISEKGNQGDDYQTQDFGHTLNWEFTWDSSKHTSVAATGVTVTFTVEDGASGTNTSQKTVNIVPYISEVYTSLSDPYPTTPSVFNRSALGGYPVRQGDSIIINGFNLGNAVTNATINGTSLSGGSNNGTKITSTVPANATSGNLVVTVNGIASFNNSTDKNKNVFYNKEPNNVNNNILDNSRYIYVWTTGDLFNGSTSCSVTVNGAGSRTVNMSSISSPFMRIDKDGNRLISHAFYSAQYNGRLRVLRNNTLIDLGTAFTNRIYYPTVGVGTTNSFYAAGTDSSSLEAQNRGFQLGFSNATGTNSINRSNANNTNTVIDDQRENNNTTVNTNYHGAYHGNIRIYNTYNTSTDRFMVPRIAVLSGSADRTAISDKILLSYYDGDSGNIEVIYGVVGATAVSSPTNTTSGNDNSNNGRFSTFSGTPAVQVSGSTYSGSIYTAAGILSDGTPLVAWYDSDHSNLIFSWGGSNSSAGTSGDWQSNSAIIDTNKGTHVDMAVDEGDNVHLAYYSNAGGLWYTFIPSNLVKVKSRTITNVRVDTYLSAGTKIMINVRKETSPSTRYVPYITYAHASFPGTKHSVRVAWLASGSYYTDFGTEQDNMFTGKWEVMTVPVNRIPNTSEFVCNGVPTAASWPAGATPVSSLNYSGLVLNKTIVVGYMTDSSYEGAILKDDITSVPNTLKK